MICFDQCPSQPTIAPSGDYVSKRPESTYSLIHAGSALSAAHMIAKVAAAARRMNARPFIWSKEAGVSDFTLMALVVVAANGG